MATFSDLKDKLMETLRRKKAEYEQGQAMAEARDDYETTDKSLRNTRRLVRRYMDKDEKAQLEAYLRARRAQEDKSWLNPYGMLENQEINISRERSRSIADVPNYFQMDTKKEISVLNTKSKKSKIFGDKIKRH